MNQISADHEKLRNVLISKLGLPADRFQRDNQIAEAVEAAVRERDDALQLRKAYNSNVKDWRELCSYFNLPVSSLSDIMSAIDTMRKERDELLESIGDVENLLSNNGLLHEDLLTSLHRILAPQAPQLNEIRYVLHGDIQPCVVLYSDDTTTLLRLDEGDIMCETDTIEWSDSVTYRCQELGRSAGIAANALRGMADAMAQLVRDERILLNDDAVTGVDEAYFRVDESDEGTHTHTVCVQCERVFQVNLDLCPQCHTPKGPLPLTPADAVASIVGSTVAKTVNAFNYAQYVGECSEHDAYPMALTEWEQSGRPHFTPEDAVETVEIHTLGEKEPRQVPPPAQQPCEDCGHVFYADWVQCPNCATLRTPKQER